MAHISRARLSHRKTKTIEWIANTLIPDGKFRGESRYLLMDVQEAMQDIPTRIVREEFTHEALQRAALNFFLGGRVKKVTGRNVIDGMQVCIRQQDMTEDELQLQKMQHVRRAGSSLQKALERDILIRVKQHHAVTHTDYALASLIESVINYKAA